MTGRTYPEYQSAPDAWMGDVPAHWGLERMKYGLTEKTTKKGPDLPPGAISYGKVVTKDAEKIAPETRATYQEVLAGEYLINPINLNYDLVSLRTALSEMDVCVSPAYIVLRAIPEKVHPVFGNYVLHVFDVCHMKTLGAGVRQTITFKDIGQCVWPLPPMDEQVVIAKFLDRETNRIDGLIEKKTRFIALLKEKRAAVITHAVTNGIDPHRDFSSTGIYWAPSVPSHWKISPFRQACWYQEGPGIMAVDFHDTGVPLLRISGVQGRYATLDGCNFLDPEKVAQKWRHFRLHEGDLLISASATMGTITEVGEEAVGAVAYTGIIRMKPSDHVTKRFLSYFLGSSIFMEQINLMKQGSTIQHFGPTHLSRVKIPLPPTDEQEAIAADLDRRTSRIDGLIALTERSIDLLREKRSALITAAVTGKIDVRRAA